MKSQARMSSLSAFPAKAEYRTSIGREPERIAKNPASDTLHRKSLPVPHRDAAARRSSPAMLARCILLPGDAGGPADDTEIQESLE